MNLNNTSLNCNFFYKNSFLEKNIGDWGLGIGDWSQSPIPNPQSPKLY